jgi:hypothetical protein
LNCNPGNVKEVAAIILKTAYSYRGCDPGIDEALEVVSHTEGDSPFGDLLPDDGLVEGSNQGLWRRKWSEPLLVGKRD